MIIVDAHQDIAYNAQGYGREYRRPAWEKRRLEAGSSMVAQRGSATLGLPDALLGRVGVVFATLFVAPYDGTDDKPWSGMTYKTPKEAETLARRQLDYYHRLVDEDERVRLITRAADLDAVLATWGPDKEMHAHRQGLVVLMENADPIPEPKAFEEWYERGVRIVGPAWEATRYSGGTGHPGPLTPLGYELLDVMAGLNAILDLSHMAEQAYFQAIDRYEGVVIASHSNPRRFRNTDRHLSDLMIQRLAERDGVMGIVPANFFLLNTYVPGTPKTDVPLSVVIDAIDYVCQLTGSAAHVGIGSDFDGGFGMEHIPAEMDTISDLWGIGAALRSRGYQEQDVEAILGGNMLRKLRQALPA